MIQISWPQFLAGLFALTASVAGATFALVTYAKEAEVAAYRLRAEMQDRRLIEIEKRLNVDAASAPTPSSAAVAQAPDGTSSDISVQILSPTRTVPQFADVKFSLTGRLPAGYKPMLVVRDPIGQWWPWGTTESSTYNSIQFGVDVDRGKQFEIRIVITNEELPLNQPRRSLPKGLAFGASVVTRQ